MLQDIYWSLRGLEYKLAKEGPLFAKLLSELERNQYSGEEALREYQDRKLKPLVAHCYENVPYYRELFRRLKLKPDDIAGQDDLWKVPYTTKEDIRTHHREFIARNAKRMFIRNAQTSGTTGKPLVLCRDRFSTVFENAMIWRLYRWAQVNPGDRLATLRGYLVQGIDDMNGPFWRHDLARRRLIMSSYHINSRTAPDYLEALKHFSPAAIEAYPSSIYSLVQHLKANGEEGLPLRAVFTSSETLYGFQRKAIEGFFGCRIFDLYGSAERVCAAGSCEHDQYHLFSDYGITELREIESGNGRPVFEIVGTGLHNYAMPILRYRTNDRAVLPDGRHSCSCGRGFPLLMKVESYRADEHLTTSDGRRLQSVEQMAEGLQNVLEYQVVQEDLAFVRIRVVAGRGFCREDENLILRKAKERLGSSMRMVVERVEAIERTKNGKYPFIVNRLGGAQAH
jgi:phenylacetate-CoA ligase